VSTLSSGARAGLYIHVPFCVAKCPYCDFSSYSGIEALYAPYVEALLQHIASAGPEWPGPGFDTLYVGGGTPTVLSADRLADVLSACKSGLGLPHDAEITCEANPGMVTGASLAILAESGFNRLSLGAQSLDSGVLRTLGRIHDPEAVYGAFRAAREAGFANIGLDLMYGIPWQTLEVWRDTLHRAVSLDPEHLSLYALTLEEGTPMAESVWSGVLPEPDEDHVADMYALAQAVLADAGYVQYEVSNWARRCAGDTPGAPPRLASRHNLHYWHNDRYLGIGSAAHSFDGRSRFARCTDPKEYVRRVHNGESTREFCEQIDESLEMDETLMLGLRLMSGVTWARFQERFSIDLRSVYPQALAGLSAAGMIEVDAEGVRMAPGAYLIGNRVFAEFLR